MYKSSFLSPEAQERTIRKTQTSGDRCIIGASISRVELESLELLIKVQLSLAVFNQVQVRVREFQKQLLLVKIEKAGLQ